MYISLQRNLEYTETQICIEVFIISSSQMICYQITSFSIFFYVNKITKRKKKKKAKPNLENAEEKKKGTSKEQEKVLLEWH